MGKLGKCLCGHRIDLESFSASGTITCPGCGRVLKARKNSEPPPIPDRICPWCRKLVPKEAMVCGNCGLDFRTGLRTGNSGKVSPDRQPESNFFSRTLFAFQGIFITWKLLIQLGVGGMVLAVPFLFFASGTPVKVYEIQPTEAFIALDNIGAYPILLAKHGGERIHLGFGTGGKHADALGLFRTASSKSPKKLYFFRESDRGDYLLVRLGISQKFLMDRKSGNDVDILLDNENIKLVAGDQTISGLFLEYEYTDPAVNAGLNTAQSMGQFLPPGFTPKIEMKLESQDMKQEVTYPGTEETSTDSSSPKGTLTGRVEVKQQRSSSKGSGDMSFLTGVSSDEEFNACGDLHYKSPTGMVVDYTYKGNILAMTWDKSTRCRRGAATIWDTRFIFDSSKWDILVLFPRPKAGTRNMELKVFDQTIKLPD